eukprot:s5066_g3.t1
MARFAFQEQSLALGAAQVLYLYAWFTRTGEIMRENIVLSAQLFEVSINYAGCSRDLPTEYWLQLGCDIRFGQPAILYAWLQETEPSGSTLTSIYLERATQLLEYLKTVPRFADAGKNWTSPWDMNFNQPLGTNQPRNIMELFVPSLKASSMLWMLKMVMKRYDGQMYPSSNHQAFAHLCVGEFLKSFLKAMLAATKLEVDRYGVQRVHLRAGCSGAAYEAVRKLTHQELMTKGTDGKPNDKGMKLLLSTLRDNIGPEKPVKVNELFFVAFYSPSDFKRLEEACIPDRLRAMMLLAFRGLTNQEQLNILASVGYDFVKISHALRIQYPACSGKPVHRKDYLGCGRAPGPAPPSPAEYEDEAFAEGDFEEDPGEALAQEYDLDDPELAEAFATVRRRRPELPRTPRDGQQTFGFKAKGEMTVDQKAKEMRKNAVKFLKTVTPCTSCGQRGHWVGDIECPNRGKEGGKSGGAAQKRKEEEGITLHSVC